jgi:hypothetical protein
MGGAPASAFVIHTTTPESAMIWARGASVTRPTLIEGEATRDSRLNAAGVVRAGS